MRASTEPANERATLDPTRYLKPKNNISDAAKDVALIVLNSPLSGIESVETLFQHAAYCVCADGGANRLHDLLIGQDRASSPGSVLKRVLPHAVHGDLDSLRDDVRRRYETLDVEISLDPDQYSTDFGKTVNKITNHAPEIKEILVLGSIGGRVDQGIGLLHELYREQKFRHANLRFWLFTEASVSILIPCGMTTILTPLTEGLIKRNIGILPLYGKAVITTQGLEWDVEEWPTEMGGNLSTSNHIVAEQVSIATNADVLLTIERACAE